MKWEKSTQKRSSPKKLSCLVNCRGYSTKWINFQHSHELSFFYICSHLTNNSSFKINSSHSLLFVEFESSFYFFITNIKKRDWNSRQLEIWLRENLLQIENLTHDERWIEKDQKNESPRNFHFTLISSMKFEDNRVLLWLKFYQLLITNEESRFSTISKKKLLFHAV